MSVRVNLEIGHEASLRTKKTPEGFTHDWEVFVRGCDNAAIHYYVEKIVFHLHETFPKPKRVVKEPPYTVKESGYAGFNLPIEIYLRNREEPKKIRFNYDLHLQQTGPPILKVQKEKYVFNLPTDDFKHKLMKGGGVIVNVTSSFQDISENHTVIDEKMQMTSKPKLSGTDVPKKYKMKVEDLRMSDSFQDLFGTPIKKPPEPKLPPKDLNKNTTIKADKGSDKDKSKSKHSPHKDKDRDRDKSKEKSDSERKNRDEKKKEKDKSKDRERSKEKSSKREKSPRPRSVSPKRPASPKRPQSPALKMKEKDEKRLESVSKEKDKKVCEEKNEKKSKKEKRDKEKEHKEKHKDRDSQKINEHKVKETKPNRDFVKEKDLSPHPPKVEKKDKQKEVSKEPEKERKDVDVMEKVKSEDKPKHKHKKKDKERREKKEEKDKSHKSEKKLDKIATPNKYHESTKDIQKEPDKNQFDSPKNDSQTLVVEHKSKEKSQKPLNALFSEFVVNDSSNSSLSSHEPSPSTELLPEKIETVKKEPIFDSKKNKAESPEKIKPKKEKVKKSKDKKSEKDGDKKRKRKAEIVEDEAPADKVPKEEQNTNSTNSDLEQATSTSPIREIDKENQENPEDYMQILKDLQHKIMTLQDNTELQKVVQLIAETGRFEVSARTFDFDLCLLERSTVRQLQEFFSNTS